MIFAAVPALATNAAESAPSNREKSPNAVPPSGATTIPSRNPAAVPARRGRCWYAYLAVFILGTNMAWAAAPDLGFSRSVTKGLVEQLSARYGAASRTRIADWQEFVRAGRAEQRRHLTEELELLDAVNAFFNRIPFVSDLAHWGIKDYWASPAEVLASNGADCEDYSIAKYFTLKEMGVPLERLRIIYVTSSRLNEAHMVLAYYPSPSAVPLILDNLEGKVRSASERSDLIPVFSFNDEDLLYAPPGQRAINAGSPLQMRTWRSLLDKLEQELRL